MAELKRILLAVSSIAFGSILYLGLNWIPIIGPLAVGFIVAYLMKENPSIGFKAGVYSASLGVIILSLLLRNTELFNPAGNGALIPLLTGWILLVWNLVGIMLAGLGGILGSLIVNAKRMLENMPFFMGNMPFNISIGTPKPRKVLNLRAPPTGAESKINIAEEEKKIKFRICPTCGSSNLDESAKCENCGKKLI